MVATSGGLDSAIVLSLADDLCKSGAASVSLLPVWYAADDDPSTDENRFIALLESERGLHVHRLCAGTPDDWAQLSGNVRQSELPVFDDGACAQAPLLAWAQEVGARTLLTGMWSDQLLFVTGYLTDLAMQLRWRQVARHMREYACWFPDADPAYFRQRFRRELLLNLTPRAVREWIRPLHMSLSRSQVRWPISEALAKRLRRHRPPTRQPRYATVRTRGASIRPCGPGRTSCKSKGMKKLVYGYGVEHVTPFLDRDVIAYLMSIPGEILNQGGCRLAYHLPIYSIY